MKCEKCSKSAVVHLTELVDEPGGRKKVVEIHLCLPHAVEAGLVHTEMPALAAPVSVIKPAAVQMDLFPGNPTESPTQETAATPPTTAKAKREGCPQCDLTWDEFKRKGLLGCPHDYQHYLSRLLPFIRRAQERRVQHIGKVPAPLNQGADALRIKCLRYQGELGAAVKAEDYKKAATLRDEIKRLEAQIKALTSSPTE
jgi:protein arginine kinase activator